MKKIPSGIKGGFENKHLIMKGVWWPVYNRSYNVRAMWQQVTPSPHVDLTPYNTRQTSPSFLPSFLPPLFSYQYLLYPHYYYPHVSTFTSTTSKLPTSLTNLLQPLPTCEMCLIAYILSYITMKSGEPRFKSPLKELSYLVPNYISNKMTSSTWETK